MAHWIEGSKEKKNRRAKLFVSIFVQSHYTPFSCLVANLLHLPVRFSSWEKFGQIVLWIIYDGFCCGFCGNFRIFFFERNGSSFELANFCVSTHQNLQKNPISSIDFKNLTKIPFKAQSQCVKVLYQHMNQAFLLFRKRKAILLSFEGEERESVKGRNSISYDGAIWNG